MKIEEDYLSAYFQDVNLTLYIVRSLASEAISRNQWFHIAASWKSGEVRLYLNGYQVDHKRYKSL